MLNIINTHKHSWAPIVVSMNHLNRNDDQLFQPIRILRYSDIGLNSQKCNIRQNGSHLEDRGVDHNFELNDRFIKSPYWSDLKLR